MIKQLFSKFSRPQEQKSFSPYPAGLFGLGAGLFSFANNSIQWMQYYATVAPVGDAVDKIAERASKILLILFAPDTEEAELPINKHPFLKLLNKPNPYQTQQDFLKESYVHERATGNNYVYLTGGISAGKDRIISDPLEMYNLRPDYMVVGPDPRDGRALYYQFTAANGNILTFDRTDIRDATGKLVEAYIEKNGFGQLYHFKNVTSRRVGGYYQLLGDAPLQSAEIQIGQYFEAAVYNYFLLKNGLSAKNIISPNVKEPISVDQLNKLRNFITQEFSGSVNSGKTIVSTLPLNNSNLSINPKDMDFKRLIDETMNTVYRKLNIPLPLVDAEHTSLANLDTSNLMLYDEAILPAVNLLADRMFTFIFKQRYKDSDKFIRLGYNESSISALQPRMAQNLKLYRESGVCTINELREYLGLSRDEGEGCDSIWIASNQMPIGKDTNLIDTIGIDQQADSKKQREIILRKQKKPDGTQLYSDVEIKKFLENSPFPN